jgi:hypothetical protein
VADPSELNLWTSQWRDVCLRRARAGYRERAVAYDCLKDKTTDYALSLKMARDVFAQVLAVWEASPVDLRPTPEKAGGVPASIAQCDKCPDPARCAGDACVRGFVAHADGVPVPKKAQSNVPPGKWKVDMPDGLYTEMPGDPPGPCDLRKVIGGYVYFVTPRSGKLVAVNPPRTAGVAVPVPHPLPAQANDGGEHG